MNQLHRESTAVLQYSFFMKIKYSERKSDRNRISTKSTAFFFATPNRVFKFCNPAKAFIQI